MANVLIFLTTSNPDVLGALQNNGINAVKFDLGSGGTEAVVLVKDPNTEFFAYVLDLSFLDLLAAVKFGVPAAEVTEPMKLDVQANVRAVNSGLKPSSAHLDPYRILASMKYQMPLEDVPDGYRNQTKLDLFAFLYGMPGRSDAVFNFLAASRFQVAPGDVTPEQRQETKDAILGYLYGGRNLDPLAGKNEGTRG